MTILNTIELTKQSMIPYYIVFACIIVGGISLSIILNTTRERLIPPNIVIIIMCLLVAFVMLVTSSGFQEPTGKYQYEITIDAVTTFADVIEKYDIIEQRGEIFVVEKKE